MLKLFLRTLIFIPLLACQSQTSPEGSSVPESKEKTPHPIYIGTVHQVYPEHHFALVRLARMVPKVGTTLISHPANGSNQRLGNLTASAEQVQNSVSRMIAADIRGGTVVKGDAVYIYQNISAHEAKKQALAEATDTPFEAAPEAETLPTGDSSRFADVLSDELINDPSPVADTPPTISPANTKPKQPTGIDKRVVPNYIENVPTNLSDWEDM